jgi:hypothetical protein
MNISSFAATSVQTSALTLQAQPAASKPQTDVTAAGTQRLGIVPPQNPVSEKGIIIVGGKPNGAVSNVATPRLGIVPPQNPVSEKGIIIVGGKPNGAVSNVATPRLGIVPPQNPVSDKSDATVSTLAQRGIIIVGGRAVIR